MQENVVLGPDKKSIRLEATPPRGQNVRRRGEDLAEGAVALSRGVRIGPGQLALAATLDRASVTCHARPIVTILSSGDELRSPGDPSRPGSIVESNGLFVGAVARRAGAVARLAPFVPDDLEATTRAVAIALATSDLVVTIGGVSVGDRDLVRAALEAAGVRILFHRIPIKPGRPVLGGRHDGGASVLGLPGNPASASLTFLLFGVPLLRRLGGESAPVPDTRPMLVRGKARSVEGRTDFIRGRIVRNAGGEPVFEVAPNQSSGAVTSFAAANAVAIVPPGRDHVQDGDVLEVLRLADIA
jgi:molybdopterin molybdotransferase